MALRWGVCSDGRVVRFLPPLPDRSPGQASRFRISARGCAVVDTLRRKPGAEIPRLPPGQQPFNSANVWNTADRAPEPPLGDDDVG
jgi:hypothetical protein